MSQNKIAARKRRGLKAKARQLHTSRPRLVVCRSSSHIYAQIIVRKVNGDQVIVASSTVDKELVSLLKGTKVERAYQVGKLLGQRAKTKEITQVAFDRSGYKYHGRIKALADGAREEGLDF